MAYRLTATAERQIDVSILEGAQRFGTAAAARYLQLILSVMADLGAGATPITVIAVPRLAGIQAYPLRLARRRSPPADRVGSPRHLVVFRSGTDGMVEILGLVHDRMILSLAVETLIPPEDPA